MQEKVVAKRIINNLLELNLSLFEAKKCAKILIFEFINYKENNKQYNHFLFLKYWNNIILEIESIEM